GNRLYDLFVDDEHTKVNPDLRRFALDDLRRTRVNQGRRSGRRRERRPERYRPPSRTDVIERLDRAGLLPAITFIFSRAGCDAAVEQCMYSGLRLTSREEAEEIRARAEERTADLP